MGNYFNEAKRKAMETGEYICSKCGAIMFFEDSNEDVLICPNCGHDVDLDLYGAEDPESYDEVFPTKEDICDD